MTTFVLEYKHFAIIWPLYAIGLLVMSSSGRVGDLGLKIASTQKHGFTELCMLGCSMVQYIVKHLHIHLSEMIRTVV